MIQPTEIKIKCDVMNCRNLAEFYIRTKGKNGRFFVCKQCLEALCKQVMSSHTPKSPKNTIKRKQDDREKDLATK